MSVHVLLILINEMGERDKMQGLPSILSFIVMSLINSGAQMLDSIKRMTLKYLKIAVWKRQDFSLF